MCAKAYVVPSPLAIRDCELKISPLLANLAIWKNLQTIQKCKLLLWLIAPVILRIHRLASTTSTTKKKKLALIAFFFSQKNHRCGSHDPETADSRVSSYSRGCSVLGGCNEWWFWASTILCHIKCSNRSWGSGCTIFLQTETPVLPGSTTTEPYSAKYCINILAKYALFPRELAS